MYRAWGHIESVFGSFSLSHQLTLYNHFQFTCDIKTTCKDLIRTLAHSHTHTYANKGTELVIKWFANSNVLPYSGATVRGRVKVSSFPRPKVLPFSTIYYNDGITVAFTVRPCLCVWIHCVRHSEFGWSVPVQMMANKTTCLRTCHAADRCVPPRRLWNIGWCEIYSNIFTTYKLPGQHSDCESESEIMYSSLTMYRTQVLFE